MILEDKKLAEKMAKKLLGESKKMKIRTCSIDYSKVKFMSLFRYEWATESQNRFAEQKEAKQFFLAKIKKFESKRYYSTEKEFQEPDEELFDMQIVFGLQTCKTKGDVLDMLKEVRNHAKTQFIREEILC